MAFLTTDFPSVLSALEAARRVELEDLVRKHIGGFRVAGNALAEIKENNLYRDTHATFSDYCAKVWDITDRRARQLISACKLADEAEKSGTTVPVNEFQARKMIAEAKSAPTATFGDINADDEPTAADDDNARPEPDEDEIERKAANKRFVDDAPGRALAEAASVVDAMSVADQVIAMLRRIDMRGPNGMRAIEAVRDWTRERILAADVRE